MHARALAACIRKETLLVCRDWHGLLLLFAMPLAFILIMSLALQEQFAARAGFKLQVLAIDRDQSESSRALLAEIDASGAFTVHRLPSQPEAEHIVERVRGDRYAFAVDISPKFGERVSRSPNDTEDPLLHVHVAADTSKQTEAVFLALLRESLGRRWTEGLVATLLAGNPTLAGSLPADPQWLQHGLRVHYAYRSADKEVIPSSVQQSVPAWLVFAAFFIVVPLSNTLIRERQQGTLLRLRSTNLGSPALLAGKLIPYFFLNQAQVALMLLVGCFVVPWVGGDRLQINGSFAMLAIMSASLSLAALGLALLIAVVSKTTEQATLLGGTGNIILAAVGGIMVPRFVMPPAMQSLAHLSPMSWGLEGFLNVLLRGEGFVAIAPYAGALAAFGTLAIVLAGWLQQRRID